MITLIPVVNMLDRWLQLNHTCIHILQILDLGFSWSFSMLCIFSHKIGWWGFIDEFYMLLYLLTKFGIRLKKFNTANQCSHYHLFPWELIFLVALKIVTQCCNTKSNTRRKWNKVSFCEEKDFSEFKTNYYLAIACSNFLIFLSHLKWINGIHCSMENWGNLPLKKERGDKHSC